MNFRKVRLIFVRELRDQLRDRRTLFMVLVLPILLYPALGIGMLQMVVVFRESPRTVVILGTSALPAPSLIADGRFSERWFSDPHRGCPLPARPSQVCLRADSRGHGCAGNLRL